MLAGAGRPLPKGPPQNEHGRASIGAGDSALAASIEDFDAELHKTDA